MKVFVSIDDEDGSRERIFLVDQPTLVKIVQLLQILQWNLILLTASPDVDSLQSLQAIIEIEIIIILCPGFNYILVNWLGVAMMADLENLEYKLPSEE